MNITVGKAKESTNKKEDNFNFWGCGNSTADCVVVHMHTICSSDFQKSV